MSDALVMFEIAVTNPYTKETAHILGQGATVVDALGDAAKLITAPWKPKGDGKAYPPLSLNVTTASGQRVARTIKEFSGGKPEVAPADDTFAL